MSVREAGVLAVGDELLAGSQPDLNTPEIARALAPSGISVRRAGLVSDDALVIEDAVRDLVKHFPLVLVTGGLGPTRDDVTRDGVASAFGRELVLDQEVLDGLEAWFAARGRPMPPDNRRQALFPEGARVLANRTGTAPGFVLEAFGRAVAALPGPPAEMRVVLAEELLPWLRATGRAGEPAPEHRFHLFGLAESRFAELCGAWMDRDEEPRMGCTVRRGVLSVVLRARGADREEARARLAARAALFRERFAAHVFSEDDPRLEHVLGRRLVREGITVTLAESCTGGLAAGLLTAVPGISAVLDRAFVTYSERAKRELLGVAPELLAAHGAVSRAAAEAMALGAARAAGARLALAVTGVAGPDGGSPAKPVGLVWIATALDGEVRAAEQRWPARERDWIRALAARAALFAAWEHLGPEPARSRGAAGGAAPPPAVD